MTEETRAELRRGIEHFVRRAMHGDEVDYLPAATSYTTGCSELTVYHNVDEVPPPLTTAQQLALSVLLGDESVLPQALADFMIDQGHEYATALAEKTRTEERRRVAAFIEIWRNYMGNSMTDRLLIGLDGRHIEGMAASRRFPYPGFTETRDRGSGAGGCDVE